MSKQLVVPCTKMTLILYESELISGLKPEVLQKALQRGKGYRRAISCEQRQTRIDRWQLYEWLKGNRTPENVASLIESMPIGELREGCIEYLSSIQAKDSRK